MKITQIVLNFFKDFSIMKFLIGVILFLFVSTTYFWDRSIRLKAESERRETNFEQIQKKGTQELTITISELKQAINDKTELGLKVDSLLKVVRAKPRQAKEIVIEKIVYRDTGRIILSSGPAIPIKSGYKIPVAFDSECWGMKAEIITSDPHSTLAITERRAINELSLLVTEKRRWIFWKKRTFQALSKCGELNITKINIIK